MRIKPRFCGTVSPGALALVLCVAWGWFSVVMAGPRGSASYTVSAESVDAGGARASSAAYTQAGITGGITGIATVASPAQTARHGYIAQLYEVTAFQVSATPATLAENNTRQLQAAATVDDGSTLDALAATAQWEVLSGPVSSVSSSGLATAGAVYQDTAAMVRGSYQGFSGIVNLTVQDAVADNFGNYAGDGLPDGWQVQTMGLNGTMGGPSMDPDGDGIPNLLEYALNLNPSLAGTLPASVLRNGNVLEYAYTRSKAAMTGGTQFQVEWSETLAAASWSGSGVSEEILSDNGIVQEVRTTLPAGVQNRRFVRLRVD